MKTLLLTNDDGILSPGLEVLRQSLEKQYEVYVVAPDSEKSAISMALTLNKPLRITELNKNRFMVNGTPADCVNLAMRKILPKPPDFIISGMNLGENLSEDVFFSGTVGGAFSGYLYGLPSMAVSLISDRNSYSKGQFDYQTGANISIKIIKKLFEFSETKTVYNVNIPFKNNGKIIVTSLGFKRYKPDIIENIDPRGRKYYWLGTGDPTYVGDKGTDVWAIKNQYISLSLLNYDLNGCIDKDKIALSFDEV